MWIGVGNGKLDPTDPRLLLGNHFISLSAPSYTCVPKLLKLLNAPANLVDVVWIAALAAWTFVRTPMLVSSYGVGFDGLRVHMFSLVRPEYWGDDTTNRSSATPLIGATLLPSSTYYLSVALTCSLFLLFVINMYWCATKVNSILKTASRLFGAKPPRPRSQSQSLFGFKQTKSGRPCYHGGRSWDASGMDILGKRAEIVVADVLDAPFAPSPRCAEAIMATLGEDSKSACIRESPPTNCEPLIQAISDAQSIPADYLLVSSGSSSVIFSVFPRLLSPRSRILTLAPTYGEYAHAFGALCDVPDGNIEQVKVSGAPVVDSRREGWLSR